MKRESYWHLVIAPDKTRLRVCELYDFALRMRMLGYPKYMNFFEYYPVGQHKAGFADGGAIGRPAKIQECREYGECEGCELARLYES